MLNLPLGLNPPERVMFVIPSLTDVSKFRNEIGVIRGQNCPK